MSVLDPRDLTPEEIQAYDRDGVVALRRALDPVWIAALRDAVDEVLARPGEQGKNYPDMGSGRFGYDTFMWLRHPVFREFQRASPLPSFAAQIMQSSRSFLTVDLLFVKEPATPNPTPWHQDQPYGWYDGWQVCSFWVPLDPVTIESGALEWVVGSHKWNRWFSPIGFDPSQYLGSRQFEPMIDVEAERDRHRIVHFDMEPGDILVHQLLTLHGAPGNASKERRRRAIAFRYAGDDARYAVRDMGPKPIRDPGLKAGDRFGCPLFPQVWPREGLQIPADGGSQSIERPQGEA